MTKDEQARTSTHPAMMATEARLSELARQRLVEIALECAVDPDLVIANATAVRTRAGFRDPCKGSWSAAGLAAAMEDAGLVAPEPGTQARRQSIALLDFVAAQSGARAEFAGDSALRPGAIRDAKPGDIIAWLQHQVPAAAQWMRPISGPVAHLFLPNARLSVCGKLARESSPMPSKAKDRCSSCVWYTRQGHVAVIVAVDDESITTVGWGEGPKPGRVMMRRLWRDLNKGCLDCGGMGRRYKPSGVCMTCRGEGFVARSSTVLWRRPGGLYGIARPVAR
jgi:hypothetical protein